MPASPTSPTTRARWRTAVLLGAALAAAGCESGTSSGSATTTTLPTACAPKAGEKPAKALLRCAESSVAFVENEDGNGTGVVIERRGKRYVLTNSHVVDPFATADVTVAGRSSPALPVIGIDAGADIALVGPLPKKGAPAPLPIATKVDLERGDDVFLVGFPGETSGDDAEELEATISSGIVSRTRKVPAFEQTYLQTDATIAGGQSGGPLFDEHGRLVGISGLSFADDEFALALSGADVSEAVDRILGGDGDPYLAVPRVETDDLVTSGSVEIADPSEYHQLFIPAADDDRTLDFTIDHADSVIVDMTTNMSDGPIATSRNSPEVLDEMQRLVAAAKGGSPDDLPDLSDYGVDEKSMKAEVTPGVFHVDIPADEDVYIGLGSPLTTVPVTVKFTSSLAVFQLTGPRDVETIEVGDRVDRVIGGYENSVEYHLDLTEGQRVEIRAESPQSDPAMVIMDPGVELTPVVVADQEGADGVELVDDSDEGLYGYDAVSKFTAGATGTYRIHLYTNDDVTVLVRLSVKARDGKSGK